MMQSYSYSRSVQKRMDWWLIGFWFALVLFGLVNIYAAIQGDDPSSLFDLSCRSGKQCIWILTSMGIAVAILFFIPPKIYETIAPFLYAITVFLLILVIFVGGSNKGSNSWFNFGPISFQPAEISKIATSLMLATIMSRGNFKLRGVDLYIVAGIIALPMLIIILEKETGSALVYVGFIFMLYREGLSGWFIAIVGLAILSFILTIVVSPFVGILVILALVSLFDSYQGGTIQWWLAIAVPLIIINCFFSKEHNTLAVSLEALAYAGYSGWKMFRKVNQKFRLATLAVLVGGIILVFSADFVFNNVLKDYQRGRIEVLLGMKEDLSGAGYNVNQSKIAIGSGGLTGKGWCNGTQTAYGFVPEQATDFIFCTVGEEWGFLGCIFMLSLYVGLIFRIIVDSEHSREPFTRIYGYCLASCLFMHLLINVGMTLGIMPVIGIPLPFMSYGGSSIWAFTIMLFIFVALDKNERKYF